MGVVWWVSVMCFKHTRVGVHMCTLGYVYVLKSVCAWLYLSVHVCIQGCVCVLYSSMGGWWFCVSVICVMHAPGGVCVLRDVGF